MKCEGKLVARISRLDSGQAASPELTDLANACRKLQEVLGFTGPSAVPFGELRVRPGDQTGNGPVD